MEVWVVQISFSYYYVQLQLQLLCSLQAFLNI